MSIWEQLKLYPSVLVLFCLGLVISFSIWPLTVFHWYLLLHNRTTHEHIKLTDSFTSPFPFKHPPCKNLKWSLCRPLPPSLFQRYSHSTPPSL
ncbi:hypothetical protein HMI55_006424 [Coelomomyces lativittatus]|nr:hypothetical protein HMI56_002587 [Coelomomyces lativittatus]KAJ1511917.1 hypothetical protein HMI55_006424 [Coelomomyces lativittatus]